jgi:hypothetical protein
MRTGYSRLNKYRNNIGQSLTPLCDCGEEETTEHYILHCHIYDHERAKLAVQLKTIAGPRVLNLFSLYWSIELLRLSIGVQGLLVLGSTLYF